MTNPIAWYKTQGWKVTSPYGPRTGTHAGFHRGVDLGGHPCGFPVKTPFSGTVVAARTSGMGTWGNTVCIELDPDGEFISLNAHLQTISVKQGQRVEQGDIIGTNGGTNHSGTNYACHIHYEILKNNGSTPWRGDIWGNPELFSLEQTQVNKSTKFKVNDKIINKMNSNIRVRSMPTTNSTTVDSILPNETIQIKENKNNGIYATNYHWWFIGSGWVAEDFFEIVSKEIYYIVADKTTDKNKAEQLTNSLKRQGFHSAFIEVRNND